MPGRAKKSRRNNKVSIKNIKPRKLKIAQAVAHPFIRKNYDKTKTPAQNLENMGLESDANNLVCARPDPSINPKFKAFVGFTEIPESIKKVKVLDEFEFQYAKNCINKHKEDYESMFRDIKLNYNQLTVNKLKKLCSIYQNQIQQQSTDSMEDC